MSNRDLIQALYQQANGELSLLYWRRLEKHYRGKVYDGCGLNNQIEAFHQQRRLRLSHCLKILSS